MTQATTRSRLAPERYYLASLCSCTNRMRKGLRLSVRTKWAGRWINLLHFYPGRLLVPGEYCAIISVFCKTDNLTSICNTKREWVHLAALRWIKTSIHEVLSAVAGARFLRLMNNLHLVLHVILSTSTADEEISSLCNRNSSFQVRGTAEISPWYSRKL